MNNGVSKKLCATVIAMGIIATMAQDAENQLPYAIIIGSLALAYCIKQGILDWRNNGKEKQ